MHDLAPVMSAVIKRTGKIELPSAGISMYPLIKEGNVSTFLTVQREELKLGDICLFVTDQGPLIGHRLYAVKQDGAQELFIFKGDTCFEPDDPVPFTSIIGRWSGVRAKQSLSACESLEVQAACCTVFACTQMVQSDSMVRRKKTALYVAAR